MSSSNTFTIPQAVTLSTGQMERIEACLDEFARSTGAWNIFLTDTTGQLIDFRGRIGEKKAEALAALIAASHAASAEFIKLFGKGTPFVNLLHEADDYSIYSTNVAGVLIVSVAFGTEVKIGVVRVFVERVRHRLSEIVHETSVTNSDAGNVKMRLVDGDFDQLLNDALDNLTDLKA